LRRVTPCTQQNLWGEAKDLKVGTINYPVTSKNHPIDGTLNHLNQEEVGQLGKPRKRASNRGKGRKRGTKKIL